MKYLLGLIFLTLVLLTITLSACQVTGIETSRGTLRIVREAPPLPRVEPKVLPDAPLLPTVTPTIEVGK